MLLQKGERLRCPKCGGKTFNATAHVTQDWELNEFGTFQKSLNDCVEVTHEPDQDDIWDCAECGFSGAGSEFIANDSEADKVILSEDRVAECVFDITLMAQHMIEEHRIDVEDSRNLFNAIFAWAKKFETARMREESEDDYMERIDEFAEEKLLDIYGRQREFKPKMILETPGKLAHEMIEDLGHGTSDSGDRWSSYFKIAKGVGDDAQSEVVVALGEEKHNLPESEWGYCLHLINDVDGSDCELYHTDHLSEEELDLLLGNLIDKMKKGEM